MQRLKLLLVFWLTKLKSMRILQVLLITFSFSTTSFCKINWLPSRKAKMMIDIPIENVEFQRHTPPRGHFALIISQSLNFFPIRSQLVQAPRFWPKRAGSGLGSNLGQSAPQLHALLSVPLWHGNQCFCLQYEAN